MTSSNPAVNANAAPLGVVTPYSYSISISPVSVFGAQRRLPLR